MDLQNHPRPKGQSEEYRFVRDATSERTFKIKREMRLADDGSPAICLSLSPTGADGHALLREDGQPDILWHTHTFTEWELAEEGFDPETTVARLLNEMATRKDRELRGREMLHAFSSKWAGARALKLTPGE